MPFEIQLDENLGIVILRAIGAGSAEEGFLAFQAISRHQPAPVLVDLLELDYTPTNEEAGILAERLARLTSSRQRIAFLAPPGPDFGVARMIATISELHGATAAAFIDRGQAVAWLRQG